MRGNYVVIEGLDNAGKTTACNTVVSLLKELGIKNIILTREPGSTYLSEEIRKLLLDSKLKNKEVLNYKAELLMFYAARIQLVETVIKPALARGTWVIGNRHDLSTQAYQGGGRGIDRKIIDSLRELALGDFSPELTIYLDITPEISLMRNSSCEEKLDRIEQESLDFFNLTRSRYLELVEQDDSIFKINAVQSLEVVVSKIREIIINWFQKKNHS